MFPDEKPKLQRQSWEECKHCRHVCSRQSGDVELWRGRRKGSDGRIQENEVTRVGFYGRGDEGMRLNVRACGRMRGRRGGRIVLRLRVFTQVRDQLHSRPRSSTIFASALHLFFLLPLLLPHSRSHFTFASTVAFQLQPETSRL